MTPEQIKALISEKIAGQGNQVDIAGALPVILGEIVDILAKETSIIKIRISESPGDKLNKEDTAEKLGISVNDVDALFAGEFRYIDCNDIISPCVTRDNDDKESAAKYGCVGTNLCGTTLELYKDSDGYSWYYGEL